MRYILAFTLFVLSHIVLYGQCQSDWVATIGGLPTGFQAGLGFALCVYEDGSILSVAHESRSDSILIGNGWIPGAGDNPLNNDFYLVKYSSDGVPLWTMYAGGFGIDFAKDAVLDQMGSVYITGQFRDTLNFNGQNAIVSTGSQDMFLCKISTDGDLIWVRQYGNSVARGVSLDVDQNGVYMAGVFFTDSIVVGDSTYQCSPPVGQSDVVVMKHDLDGNLVWSRHLYGEDTQQVGALAANNGTIVLAGVYKEELISHEETLLGNSTYTYYLLKMNSLDGGIDWIQQSVGGGLSALVENIVFDEGNNIYLSGRFNTSTIAFQNLVAQNNGNYDYFILKTGPSGVPEWITSSDGSGFEIISGMDLVGSSLLVTGGFTQTSFSLGNDVLSNVGDADVFLAEYDINNGQAICGDAFSGNGVEQGLSVVVINDSVYVQGLFTGELNLDGLVISPIGNQDLFVWKTCLPCNIEVGGANVEEHPNLLVYPNPTTSQLNIKLSPNQKATAIGMVDMLGKEVLRQPFATQLNVSHLPAGYYVLAVYTENGVLREKVVIAAKE